MITLEKTHELSEGSIWRHKKSLALYVILGHCVIEKTYTTSVIYQGIENPRRIKWVRPEFEFLDGRFEFISNKIEEA